MSLHNTIRPQVLHIVVFVLTTALAMKLFAFGLGYTLDFRVRGDAYSYLVIADGMHSWSDAWRYAGERSAGVPLLAFAVREGLVWIGGRTDLQSWVDAVCTTLFLVHMVAMWKFSGAVAHAQLLRTDAARYGLFAFLATFPALIGHTTSPLSDTLALDLLLFGVVVMRAAMEPHRTSRALLLATGAGCFLGLAILVRPGSQIAIFCGWMVMVMVGASLHRNCQRNAIVLSTLLAGALLVLAPYAMNCNAKYGKWCVQSPATGDIAASMQAGLRGARTLWAMSPEIPGAAPVLADSVMLENFYARCSVSTLFGFDESSLTGCLTARPVAATALVFKKWIGLFDHFRFTPYLENDTPVWLVWLSRGYDTLAWVGLFLTFHAMVRLAMPGARREMRRVMLENASGAFLVTFSIVMLAQHTALHVEDRYGFPVLPLCAVVLIMYGECAIRNYRQTGLRPVLPLLSVCVLAAGLFLWQVQAWDAAALAMGVTRQ